MKSPKCINIDTKVSHGGVRVWLLWLLLLLFSLLLLLLLRVRLCSEVLETVTTQENRRYVMFLAV